MAQSRVEKMKQKKKKPMNRFVKITLLTFLALFVVAGGAFAYVMHKVSNVASGAQQELERGDRSELRDNVVNPIKDPVSVLFLGLDSRGGDLSGRTDAMVLATFNPDENTIKMLNIPRDSRVELAGRGTMDKINHAHAFGGLDMTIATVENLFDIPVDYFVSLNFDAFMDIINELGGVTVNSPMTFTEKDNGTYGTITIHEGEQHLNGQEALAYVRMRKSDPRGDLGRGERQKEVIESIIREAASFSSITRFGPVMDAVGKNLKTNLSFNNLMSMHSYASKLNEVESLQLQGENAMINRIYYYQLNPQSVIEISETFQRHLNIIEDDPIIDQEENVESW
ncbi:transcriptional regulator [Anaerobacillus alkalilacustris]|uniref:Transcriptional regulator n=1 Tax=Anaerobacillus alkalilacustris TaxID=393763 RepID=A0A1S2LGQ8_9BACI|nr:LCP family protein [Anaerobacillus alkalilacustris]OIJ11712.1 transcriptional regulator [Anaerobacillus alkalilacustris]